MIHKDGDDIEDALNQPVDPQDGDQKLVIPVIVYR
jgi:hypothetical protein